MRWRRRMLARRVMLEFVSDVVGIEMELDTVAVAPKPGVLRAWRRRQVFVVLAVVALLPLIWLLRSRLVARTGMDPDAALFAISLPLGGVGGGCLWLWGRLAGWGKEPASPSERARLTEWALRLDRRIRPWAVGVLVLMLLRTLVGRVLMPIAAPVTQDAFAFVWPFLMFAQLLIPDLLRSGRGTYSRVEERVQAVRQEAVRCGYGVLVVLGGANMVVASFWPLVAIRA